MVTQYTLDGHDLQRENRFLPGRSPQGGTDGPKGAGEQMRGDAVTLVAKYLRERSARQELAASNLKNLRWILVTFAVTCPDDPALIRRRHVERWLEQQQVSPGTLRTRLSTVRTFCRWLVLNGHIRIDPTVGIAGPRKVRHLPRALPRGDVAATLMACANTRARLIVSLMVQEGLRRAEVAGIQTGDVDLRARLLVVRGKGDAERYLPITDPTMRALAAYLVEHPMSAGPLIRSFADPRRALAPPTVGRIVTAAMRAGGVKHRAHDGRSAHALRHTAASDVLEQGAHIVQVQAMLGHESLETTRKYLRRVDAVGLLGVMNGRDYWAAVAPEPPVA